MKRLFSVLGILALVGAGVVGLIAMGVNSFSAEFKPLVATFLKDCSAGKVSQTYDAASPEFKQTVTLEKFQEMMAACRSTLGEFKETGSMTGFSRQVNNSASTGEISLNLKYSKAETAGKFVFIKQGETWRLLSFSIHFP